MERKAIRLSKKTLVISLPSGWVARNGVKKGDTLLVDDKEHEILISLKRRVARRTVEIDVRGCGERLMRRMVAAAYKRGFECLEVICDKGKEGLAERACAEFIGITTERRIGRIVVEDITGEESVDFFNVFRKVFFNLSDAVDEMNHIVLDRSLHEGGEITRRKEEFLRQAHFAAFVLHKHGARSIRETNIAFAILSILDSIGDLFFRAGARLLQKRQEGEIAFFIRISSFIRKVCHSFTSGGSVRDIYLLRETLYPNRPERTPDMVLLSVVGKLALELVECKIMFDLARDNEKV